MKISFDKSDINFYFSFQCPYSYLAWEYLKDYLKDNEHLSVKPISIGLFPPRNSKFSYREVWGDFRWERLAKDAEKTGLLLHKPLEIYPEEIVGQSIEAYGELGAEYFISTIFKAEFQKQINISVNNNLRYFLQSEGIDSNILLTTSENKALLEKYNEKIETWTKERIRSTPTIAIGKERLAGMISRDQLERFVHSLLE